MAVSDPHKSARKRTLIVGVLCGLVGLLIGLYVSSVATGDGYELFPLFAFLAADPIIAKTGVIDEQWEKLRSDNPNIWDDKELIEAGKQYATLYNAQSKAIISRKGLAEYAEKALNYAIISSWAYVAGLLQDNKTRLGRHYALADKTSTDPLNAIALSKGRHKTDPENNR